MSATKAFGSPLVRGDVSFPILLAKQYGELEDAARLKRKQLYEMLLSECEIKGADRFVALRDALGKDVGFSDVNAYLGTYSGTRRTFRLSLCAAGKTVEQADEIFHGFDALEAFTLARQLVGFLTPEGQRDPLSGTSGTGGEPAPSSDASTALTPTA